MPGQIGNKGGGRHPIYEEFNKASAINKLWAKVAKKVESGEELSDYEQKLVLALLPKTIKTESEVDARVEMAINIDGDIANKNAINAIAKGDS